MTKLEIRQALTRKMEAKGKRVRELLEALASETGAGVISTDTRHAFHGLNLIEELSREHKQMGALNELSGAFVDHFVPDDAPPEKAPVLQ